MKSTTKSLMAATCIACGLFTEHWHALIAVQPLGNQVIQRSNRPLFPYLDVNGWGYFDRQLEIVIQPRFRSCEEFSEDEALVELGNELAILSDKGEIRPLVGYSAAWRSSCGRIRVSWQVKMGGEMIKRVSFVDPYGKRVSDASFDDARDFSEGFAAVKESRIVNGNRTDVWGFVGLKLEQKIPFEYADVGDFSANLAAVQVGRRWGYINRDGRIVIEPRFQLAGEFKGELATVMNQGTMMYINRHGEVVIPGPYEVASDFSEGVASVTADVRDGWFYIDPRGRPLFFRQFTICGPFSEGVARVLDGEKWGYIDKKGEWVVPAIYDEAFDFRSGLAVVRSGSEYWYIDKANTRIRRRS
jgi:hypothetical protein